METTAAENPEAIVVTINRVNETNQASIVTIGGRAAVAIVPLDYLRELEDRLDAQEVRLAEAEGGEIPWEDVRNSF